MEATLVTTEIQPEKPAAKRETGMDGPLSDALLKTRRFFTKAEVSADLRTMHKAGGREADDYCRDRWGPDKEARPPAGQHCPG